METNIYLDAGHGGYDNGATYNGRKEKDDNLKLTQAVGKALRDKGIMANFTRVNDVYQSPGEKAQIANEDMADLFVSFHRSSSPVPNTYNGVEAYVYETGGDNEKLAKEITNNLEEAGFKNLGVHVNKNLTVLKKTKMPAILLDVGFVNTDSDNKIFDENFDKIVNAIVNAITASLGQREQQVAEEGADYTIQVGLFRNPENADNLVASLQADGYDAMIEPMGGYSAVLVGRFSNQEEAEKTEEKLQNGGYETFLIER